MDSQIVSYIPQEILVIVFAYFAHGSRIEDLLAIMYVSRDWYTSLGMMLGAPFIDEEWSLSNWLQNNGVGFSFFIRSIGNQTDHPCFSCISKGLEGIMEPKPCCSECNSEKVLITGNSHLCFMCREHSTGYHLRCLAYPDGERCTNKLSPSSATLGKYIEEKYESLFPVLLFTTDPTNSRSIYVRGPNRESYTITGKVEDLKNFNKFCKLWNDRGYPRGRFMSAGKIIDNSNWNFEELARKGTLHSVPERNN